MRPQASATNSQLTSSLREATPRPKSPHRLAPGPERPQAEAAGGGLVPASSPTSSRLKRAAGDLLTRYMSQEAVERPFWHTRRPHWAS